MKNEFVPYKEALALKELGFDYCCFCSYNSEGKLAGNYGTYYKIHLSEVTIAPLFQQAFRWFREKYIYSQTYHLKLTILMIISQVKHFILK
jgi:hypothetical protein